MAFLFLATLGTRPEAITVALDVLKDRYGFQCAIILHTEPRVSGIATAYRALQEVMRNDYPTLTTYYRELTYPDGAPILDTETQHSVEAYFTAVYRCLRDYKENGDHLHLLIAGGRKAMSIYATLAASLVFDIQDQVWTVLSSPDLLNESGQFHIPPGKRDQVQVVALPMLTARLLNPALPPELRDDPHRLIQQQDHRLRFIESLTKAEQQLVNLLCQMPYAKAADLADKLGKSQRTVETQLRRLYQKMELFWDFGDQITDKKQALIDLVREIQ